MSLAVLVLLESLSPVERAVFVLREAFDYGYDEIAEIVDKSEDNCRQLAVRARRARRRAGARASSRHASSATSSPRRFFAALREGETEPLVELLAAGRGVLRRRRRQGAGRSSRRCAGAAAIARMLAGFGRVARAARLRDPAGRGQRRARACSASTPTAR